MGKISEAGSSQALTPTSITSHGILTCGFDGERLGVVFEDLKRAFNIEIRAGDPAINDYRLTSLLNIASRYYN